MCNDILTQLPSYVEIKSLEFHKSNERRVVLTLEDGSSVTTTADHPVRVSKNGSHPAVLPAGELIPEEHRLRCFRMVDLMMTSVRTVQDTSPRVVELSVCNSQQHQILVANPQSKEFFADAVPVGSADSLPQYLDIQADLGLEGRTLRRCASEPAIKTTTRRAKSTRDWSDVHSSTLSSRSQDIPMKVVLGAEDTATINLRGMESLGGLLHPEACSPCRFHRKVGYPCSKGKLCEYCHIGDHEWLPRKGRPRLR